MAVQVRMKQGKGLLHFRLACVGQKSDNKETPAETVRAREMSNGKCAIAGPDTNFFTSMTEHS